MPLSPHRFPFLVLLAAFLLGDAAAVSSAPGNRAHGEGLPYPHRKLANVTFVAFDTETTGLNPKRDRIVELAAVKYRDGKIIEEKTWLIDPERRVPRWAETVHGISTAMLKDAPVFKEVYPEFQAFIEGSVLVAHNAPFDIAFVNEEVHRAGLRTPANEVIDSLGLFRTWFPDLKSYTLEKVARHARISRDAFHRALADSMYVARIFNKGARRFDDATRLSTVYADAGGTLKF
jgi:DNA polymerase III epsilon subunit family exonuclease